MTKKKVLIGCGIVLLFAILCAAGCSAFVYYQAKHRIVTDPARAAEIAREIMQYDIPGGDTGVMGMDLFVVKMGLVTDRNDPPHVILMLMEIFRR